METTPSGSQVRVKTVETATVAGSVFGIAIAGKNRGVYFVDDGDDTLKLFTDEYAMAVTHDSAGSKPK